MTGTNTAPEVSFNRILVALKSKWGHLPAHLKHEIQTVEHALSAPTDQEPVAWMLTHENPDIDEGFLSAPDKNGAWAAQGFIVTPIYTRPQPDRGAELEAALRSWEAEHAQSIRRGLSIEEGYTEEDISKIIDSNLTIMRIRAALFGG